MKNQQLDWLTAPVKYVELMFKYIFKKNLFLNKNIPIRVLIKYFMLR